MKSLMKVDLRIARQRSALAASDVAFLLGCSTARLSKLENGHARPRIREVIALSIVYGQTIDSLFQLTTSRLTEKLKANLSELDFGVSDQSLKAQHRLDTLNALVERLRCLNNRQHV